MKIGEDKFTQNIILQLKTKKLKHGLKKFGTPINRLISQIIKPLNNEIKELSADPYDE